MCVGNVPVGGLLTSKALRPAAIGGLAGMAIDKLGKKKAPSADTAGAT